MMRPRLGSLNVPVSAGSGGLAFALAALRRLGFVAVLLSIFAVGFGGTFTCTTSSNSHHDHTRPDTPP